MKTGLGLNFLRIVNEEGFDGWAQVYARIPFSEDEIKKKGALFGAIFSTDLNDWTSHEAEIMTWVDEYFNAAETAGDLTGILGYLSEKYPGMSSVWMWVTLLPGGKREIKVIKNNRVGVWLYRNGEKNDLSKFLVDEKSIKGSIQEGDKILFWAGSAGDLFENIETIDSQDTVVKVGDALLEQNRGGASLIFTFDAVSEDAQAEEVIEEKEVIVPEEKVYSPVYIKEDNEAQEESRELVTDQYVGKVGPKEKLINWWKNKSYKNRTGIVVGRPIGKRRKLAVGLGMLFLILLAISIVSGSIKIKADNEQKKWNQFYEPIEKKRLEALGLYGVNLVGSRKLMEEVKADFEAGKNQFVNTRFKTQLSDLENKINGSWSTASGEKQSTFVNQLDIGLIRTGFSGKTLSLIKKSSFLALDNTMGLVVSADADSKDIKVLAGKGEGLGWIDTVYDGKRNLLLDPTGVSVVESGKRVASFDAAVGKPISIGVFGANVYVLDQGNKEIYRYNNADDQLGDRNRWLKQGQSIGHLPLDMAINGDIWILEEGNSLERFRRGSKENFSLNGVPEKAVFSRVAVEVSGTRLALLDSVNGSISVFKKDDGTYIEQLKMDSLKQATDLEFDESGNLWVLVRGVIGSIK